MQTHCLIYGQAKTGKTRLIPTAPNPIVCNADNGLSSIREHNLPFVNCFDWAAVMEFSKWILESKEANQFETVFFDDLTEIAEQFLVKEKPKHKNLMQAYGELNDSMMKFVRDMRNSPTKNIVFICKQERIKDETTGGLIYSPAIPGKAVAPMLPYLWGEVYHMESWTDPTTNVRHEVLRTKGNDQYVAGSRSGKLGEIEFANLGAIFQKVKS